MGVGAILLLSASACTLPEKRDPRPAIGEGEATTGDIRVRVAEDLEQRGDLETRLWNGKPLLSGSTRISRGPLRCGVAKADLLEGWMKPVQMATYGPSPGVARDVREPVYARALVLDNTAQRLAVVSCDLLIMDLELRQEVLRLARERGLALDDLLLVATHTHTSVGAYVNHWAFELYMLGGFDTSMREHLAERVVVALERASASLKPARLGVGRTFVEGVSENRRVGTAIDPEVGIVKVTDGKGEPLAVVVNFAAHPILEPQDQTISPDYPGLLAKKLEKRHGFGLFLQGALGDVNARVRGAAQIWDAEGLAETVAERLAAAVDEALGDIPTQEDVELGSMTTNVDLPALNVGLIPDLLCPFDWLFGQILDWPRKAPLQAMRIGDAAIIASSTELGVRLGRRIKRRSPSPFPFVVTHANGYTGYAVTAVNHAKRKLDPTSLVSLHGSRHGTVVVEAACDLLEVQWGERLDAQAKLLSPAAKARLAFDKKKLGLPLVESPLEVPVATAREEEELLVRTDPTLPQSRRLVGLVGDSLREWVRLEVAYLYQEDLRGGQRIDGRRRELMLRLRLRGPWDLRLDGRFGYVRSEWERAGGPNDDEGLSDLTFGLERPFLLYSDPLAGTALRAIPRIALTAPTGNAEPLAPLAFAVSSGVLRPAGGAALEFTWETYRTVVVEGLFTTSADRDQGRRPGETFQGTIGYRERHGIVSLLVDFTAALQFPDTRTGGSLPVDVEEASFQLGLRPGLTLHPAEEIEIFAQAIVPLAQSGSGAGEGSGVAFGIAAGF